MTAGPPATGSGGRSRLRLFALIAAGGAALVLLVLAVRIARKGPREVAGELPRDGLARVAGVVHVHTTLSDGGGSPEEVIAAARFAGLQFLAISDHNTLDAKPFEGHRDGVLVLVGVEVSTTAGHLLGLGIPDPAFRFSGDVTDALEDVRDLGGIGFAAHPSSPRADLRWTGWEEPGPWGLELMNGDSEWRAAGARLLGTLGLYALNKREALLAGLNPPDEVLGRWDALLARRDVPALAGADAHSRVPIVGKRGLRFPSYESMFSVMRNHVLLPTPFTGDAALDSRALLEALAHGRCYVGLDGLAPAGSFSFTVEGSGRRWTLGDHVPAAAGLKVRAGGRLPQGARLRLLRDGETYAEAGGPLDVDAPGAGVYRVEVRLPGVRVPWILSNPIYVFDEATLAERAARGQWPPAPIPPPAAVTFDSFEGGTIFQAGARPSSALAPEILDPQGGVDGGGAARLAFHLLPSPPEGPPNFAAIINREARDLSGRQGLVFAIRADGVYRMWVQVRDENPASADEGTEWWYASARTSTEWRRVALPFSRFRSFNKRSDGRLDLDQVLAIVFVLETATVRAGTRGTIWLDDVGAY